MLNRLFKPLKNFTILCDRFAFMVAHRKGNWPQNQQSMITDADIENAFSEILLGLVYNE